MSSITPGLPLSVIPAQLSFLSIYNPSLGTGDDSIRDQIVFYSSQSTRSRRVRQSQPDGEANNEKEEENEKLRQVGLAQGMVDFANNFSNGETIDSIETEKSRVVLHELEKGWWILASIDLTRLPSTRSQKALLVEPDIDYSSREVSPPQLLIDQLTRAHSIFLLHHASTLADLYVRLARPAFCNLLDRFWTRFIWNWDVLLHGNPIVELYNGIKLSAGGELGIGVGEEDWGSGEREVLEDFVARTDGLVDLVVSRFGDAPLEPRSENVNDGGHVAPSKQKPWLATDTEPRPSDGVLFSGVGALSRRSLATISQWIEWVYRFGEEAYGVGESPTSRHRRKRRKLSPGNTTVKNTSSSQPRRNPPKTPRKIQKYGTTPPGIPPPLVKVVEQSLDEATSKAEPYESTKEAPKESIGSQASEDSSMLATDKMMSYLTLGYGSAWTLNPKGLTNPKEQPSPLPQRVEELRSKDGKESKEPGPVNDEQQQELQEVDPRPEVSDDEGPPFVQRLEQSMGKYLIGLTGDLENAEFEDDSGRSGMDDPTAISQDRKSERIILRTINVDMAEPHPSPPARPPSHQSTTIEGKTSAANSIDGAQVRMTRFQKMQIVVYVHQPFIIAFLFQLHTPTLTLPAFYRSIHQQLGPLQRPLLRSTDPEAVATRIADAMGERSSTTSPPNKNTVSPGQTIYDIVHDPAKLTVRSSLPNIPPPGSPAAEGLDRPSGPITVSGSWYTLGIPVSSTTPPQQQQQPTHASPANSEWTRVEALNVHTQILSLWVATRQTRETERTVKTARAWWVLWMRISSPSLSTYDATDPAADKEAFLVKKATTTDPASAKRQENNRAGSGPAGKWLLREQTRETSGGSVASSGAAAGVTVAASVGEGVVVDAKRWVDGLLSLNR